MYSQARKPNNAALPTMSKVGCNGKVMLVGLTINIVEGVAASGRNQASNLCAFSAGRIRRFWVVFSPSSALI
jgi:hypothetical protein